MTRALAGLVLASIALGQEGAAGPRVVIVPITGALDVTHVALVRRAARRIKEVKPALVVVEIDTPGGRIDHMLSIGETLMGLDPVPTFAYVRHADSEAPMGAVSAGVYLAISCKRIYMQPGTIIGGAMPIEQGAEGVKPVGEKFLSVAREKFRARADQNGYPGGLIVAMVDPNHEIYEIELEGKKRFVTPEELDKLRDEGKPFDRPAAPYKPKGRLLTLTESQAVSAGLARSAAGRGRLYEDAGLSSPVEEAMATSWSEKMVGFLSNPLVSFLLMAVGILGIWVEFKTPGFGAAGVIGILAIGLLLFGNYMVGLAEVPEILVFAVGVALVAVEIFVLPGTGVFAVLGILCVFAGLILSFQDFTIPDPKAAPWQVDIFINSIGRVVGSFTTAAIGLLALMRFLPKVPVLGRMVLKEEITAVAPAPESSQDLVGRMGHAVTPLKPGGKVEIDGQVIDALSEGEFVAMGEPVEILRIDGMHTLVRKAKR
jgi:membrane-bound serine protease (ClpP class)